MRRSDSDQLPKGWVWTQLGEILDFVKGKKPKNLGALDDFLKVRYIDIKAFENGVIERFTDGVDCPLCETKDVLIVWDGARCGLVGRGAAGAIGSTLAKLVHYELNPTYLFYFLQSKYEYINKRPRGVGIPHVEPNTFWSIPMPLPPRLQQDRIVSRVEELFSVLDAGVESLRKAKAQLKRYRQAVLKYAFDGKLTEEWRKTNKDQTEPAQKLLERIEKGRAATESYEKQPTLSKDSILKLLPENWIWTSFGHLLESSQNGLSKRRSREGKPVRVLRLADIENNKIMSRTPRDIKLTDDEIKRFLLNQGDLLCIRVNGSRDITGRLVVFNEKEQWAFCDHLIRLRLLKGLVLPQYVQNYFNTQTARMYIESNMVSSAGQNTVSQATLMRVPVPLAPETEQFRIVAEIERHFSLADSVEKIAEQSLEESELLRQSILRIAFEGKLVPQDSTDEPAEKLLARIKEEKAKHAIKTQSRSIFKKMGLMRYV